MEKINGHEYYTPKEAAKMLDLKLSGLYTQIKLNRIKHLKLNASIFIIKEEIKRYRDQRLGKPGRPKKCIQDK